MSYKQAHDNTRRYQEVPLSFGLLRDEGVMNGDNDDDDNSNKDDNDDSDEEDGDSNNNNEDRKHNLKGKLTKMIPVK